MDRTAWIVVILCVLGLVGSQVWYQKTYVEPLREYEAAQAAERQKAMQAAGTAETPAAAAVQPEATPTPAAPVAETVEAVQEQQVPVETTPKVAEKLETLVRPKMTLDFTNHGGGIQQVILNGHTIDGEEPIILNKYREIPIGALSAKPASLGDTTYTMRVDEIKGEVVFENVTSDQIKVTKTFMVAPKDSEEGEAFQTKLNVSFTNLGAANYKDPGYYINLGSIVPIHDSEQIMYTGYAHYQQGKKKFIGTNWFEEGRIPLIGIQTREARPVYSQASPGEIWSAIKNQYFATILTSLGEPGDMAWAKRFEIPAETHESARVGVYGAMGMPGFEIAPGASHSEEFVLYTGPQIYQWVEDLGNEQEKILKYGFFKWISLTLLNSMNFFKGVFGSYAIAIIVLTLIIKSLLFPLQNKATKSMRKMSALSPKLAELKEKYKDDPTKMNQEMMGMYKTYGINPFGGCLPMLVQIPIFFGFYSMLGSAVELRNNGFLWIDDLSQPDTVFLLFGALPVNILPLLMAGTMLWQMQITPKSGDAMQQKMFMFMPLIFVIFCYNFASALALYWTVQNLFSIVQLYLTRNQPLPALTKVERPTSPQVMNAPSKERGPKNTKSKKKRKR